MRKFLGSCVVLSAMSLSLGCGGGGGAPAPETNLEEEANLEADMADQEKMAEEMQGGAAANP